MLLNPGFPHHHLVGGSLIDEKRNLMLIPNPCCLDWLCYCTDPFMSVKVLSPLQTSKFQIPTGKFRT